MNIIDYFAVTAIISTCTTILGWWLKVRLDSSIKYEYDKIIEVFKSELKRSDILLAERLSTFKATSIHLLELRRYCQAKSTEFRNESEFEARTESLTKQENIGLLNHHENLKRSLDNVELFISPKSRKSFEDLFMQLHMGFNLESWLSHDDPASEIVSNAYELYESLAARATDVLAALYSDLGLPENLATRSSFDVLG